MEKFTEYANSKGTVAMKKFILPFALALAVLPLQADKKDKKAAKKEKEKIERRIKREAKRNAKKRKLSTI